MGLILVKRTMRLSNPLMAKINLISSDCSNTILVAEAMKRSMKTTMDYLHSRYVMDLFRKLQQKRIGTSNVTGLCKRICEKLPPRRELTLIDIVMRWKLVDARTCYQTARRNNTVVWREVRPVLQQANVCRRYEELWKLESSNYAQELRLKLTRKLRFLQEKYKDAPVDVPDVLQDITIADQELSETFSSEPRSYGGVNITENESRCFEPTP